jgi:PAS domain S-box-containing protein
MPKVQDHRTESDEEFKSTESEITFQTVFENAFFGMVLVGSDGCFIKANQAACDLFGYSQDELLTMTFKDLTYPDDLDAGIDLFSDLMGGNRKFAKMEKRYVKKDGRVIWTLISTSVVQKSSGTPPYLVTLFQDITNRKQAESDLAEKEQQYRSIFEDAFDGILINDLNGVISEVNPAFCRMHDYSRDELVGQTPKILIRNTDYPVFSEYLDTVRQGKPFRGRAVDIRKDGTTFHVEVHGSPISYRSKPHVLGIVRDVTSQVQNEAVLEDLVASRTQELSALVNVTNVASSSLDLKEVVERSLDSVLEAMQCDMGAVHLLNETQREVTLTSWRNVPKEIVDEIEIMPINKRLPGRILDQDTPLIIPNMLRDPDTVPAAKRILGKRVYLGVPMKAKGKTIGVLVIIGQADRIFDQEEISLLSSIAKQIGIAVENARLHSQAEILAISEERQRIAREIHDTLAQGLTGIKIQLEAIESALEMGNGELALKRLDRTRFLANQSLAEARRSVWALRSQSLVEKDLSDALRDSVHGLTAGTRLDVSLKVQDDLPHIPQDLQSDLLRVSQEAVMNVIKHAQAKHLTISLGYKDNQIVLKICDDGRGFSPNNVSMDREEGSGFGLLAMQERAERYGGRLQIESQPQFGTCITASIEYKD